MAETALPRALFHRLPLDLVGRVALRLLAGVVIGLVSSLLGVAGGDYHPHLSPRLRVGRQVGGDRRSRQIRWPQVWNADRVRAVLPPVKASVKGGRRRADDRRCFEGIFWIPWTGAPSPGARGGLGALIPPSPRLQGTILPEHWRLAFQR